MTLRSQRQRSWSSRPENQLKIWCRNWTEPPHERQILAGKGLLLAAESAPLLCASGHLESRDASWPASSYRWFKRQRRSARLCAGWCKDKEMKRWTRWKTQWTSLPFMSQRHYQVDSFVCSSFVSGFLLLNFLPNSSSFPGMITRPKNVFLQVFNTPSLKRGPSGCFVCALLF